MSSTFVAVYRDKTGTKHEVPCDNLDHAMAFLRAHIDRIRDAVSAEVLEYEPKHRHPKTLAECHEVKLVAFFTVMDGVQP
jgi:hypothetical protein